MFNEQEKGNLRRWIISDRFQVGSLTIGNNRNTRSRIVLDAGVYIVEFSRWIHKKGFGLWTRNLEDIFKEEE